MCRKIMILILAVVMAFAVVAQIARPHTQAAGAGEPGADDCSYCDTGVYVPYNYTDTEPEAEITGEPIIVGGEVTGWTEEGRPVIEHGEGGLIVSY